MDSRERMNTVSVHSFPFHTVYMPIYILSTAITTTQTEESVTSSGNTIRKTETLTAAKMSSPILVSPFLPDGIDFLGQQCCHGLSRCDVFGLHLQNYLCLVHGSQTYRGSESWTALLLDQGLPMADDLVVYVDEISDSRFETLVLELFVELSEESTLAARKGGCLGAGTLQCLLPSISTTSSIVGRSSAEAWVQSNPIWRTFVASLNGKFPSRAGSIDS